jgi:hypothetical protein
MCSTDDRALSWYGNIVKLIEQQRPRVDEFRPDPSSIICLSRSLFSSGHHKKSQIRKSESISPSQGRDNHQKEKSILLLDHHLFPDRDRAGDFRNSTDDVHNITTLGQTGPVANTDMASHFRGNDKKLKLERRMRRMGVN